jgi:hypothetical protein
MLPEGGIPLVAEIYSGELRVVNDVGVSLTLLTNPVCTFLLRT